MEDIKIIIPVSRLAKKLIKGKEGDFTINGIEIGGKFIRLTMKQGHRLPDSMVEGHLYGRKYKARGSEYTEVAIWIDNSIEDKSAPSEDTPF